MVLKIAFLNAGLVFGAIIIGMCLTPWLIVTCYSEKYVDSHIGLNPRAPPPFSVQGCSNWKS